MAAQEERQQREVGCSRGGNCLIVTWERWLHLPEAEWRCVTCGARSVWEDAWYTGDTPPPQFSNGQWWWSPPPGPPQPPRPYVVPTAEQIAQFMARRAARGIPPPVTFVAIEDRDESDVEFVAEIIAIDD